MSVAVNPNLEPIVFDDLAPVEIQVTFRKRDYVLTELDVPNTAKFKSVAAANFTYNGGEMSGLKSVGDLDPLLVELSLKEVYDGDKRRPVSKAFVNTMPATLVKQLAERAKEINPALDEKPTVESLTKQIDRLTALRDKLKPADEDAVKN